jgi:hypothetical protein
MRYAFTLIGTISMVSLAVYGFFYKLVDAPQFYTNNLPLLNVFFILAAAYFFVVPQYSNAIRRIVGIGLSAILVIMMISSSLSYTHSRSFTELYSDKYLCELDSIHKHINGRSKIAVLYDPYQKPDLYNCDMSGPNLFYQPYFSNFSVPIDINILAEREMPWGGIMGEVQKRFVAKAPFKRFVLQQMAEGKYKDVSQSQVEYLRKERIRYVFVSANVEPDHNIVAFVKNRFKDARSGEQLLVLNEWP